MRAVAKMLRITDLLDKKPSALSGGDMQRVAIGRALVRRPKAMLMDEPIGALDAKLREEMRAEIKRLHLKQGSTTIYVTHDQIEAMSLADRIVIMHEGVLQQVGSPVGGLCASDQSVRRPVRRQPGDECRQRVGRGQTAARPRVTVDGAADGFAFPRELLSKLNGTRPSTAIWRSASGRKACSSAATAPTAICRSRRRSSSRSAPTTSST